MPGIKRTFSSAFPDDEGSSKPTKRASSTMSSPAAPRKSRSDRKLITAKRTTVTPAKEATSPTPALRRASTLTIDEEDEIEKMLFMKTPTKKSFAKVRSGSAKKGSGAKGTLTTRLSGLKSGSLVGETSVADVPSTTKKASITKTSSKTSTTGSSSGTLKPTLSKTSSISSKHVSKSATADNIEEKDLAGEVAVLRTRMSSEKSKPAEAGTSAEPAGVALPPGGLVEVAVSFDTTGSMYGCLAEVRSKIQDLVQRLQADIPGIRIAIIAHGDYCDEHSSYLVKWIDFGGSLPEICDFVKNVDRTGGGDGPECYELVLQRAREVLSWTPGSQRVLIMIGDDQPHPVGYQYFGKTYNIDWREECKHLRDMGVKVYGVQSGHNASSTRFNQEMARLTNGCHLPLSDFSSIFDFLMMICYREGNPDMMPLYEQEVRARHMGGMAKDFAGLAKTLGAAAPDGGASVFAAPPPTLFAKVSPPPTLFAKKVTTAIKKSPKGKATAKSKVVKPKRVGKKKKKLLIETVQKRETMPDTSLKKGPLKKFAWTRWVCAIVPNLPTTAPSKYKPCFATSGFRLKKIFGGDLMTPSVYEFAVQVKRNGKKHVVYYRKVFGNIVQRKRAWDLYFLKHWAVQKEINNAMKNGCSIWVRRGTLKPGKASRQVVQNAHDYLYHNVDYAWKKYIWRRTDGRLYHRHLSVRSRGTKAVTISDGDF